MAKDQFSAAVCGTLQQLQAVQLLTVDERSALRDGNWRVVLKTLYSRAHELQRGPCGRQFRACMIEVLKTLVQGDQIKVQESAIRGMLLRSMHDRGLALVGDVPRGENRRDILAKAANKYLSRDSSYWQVVFRQPEEYFEVANFDTKPFLKLFAS